MNITQNKMHIREIKDFKGIKNEWNDVLRDSGRHSIFLSFEYIELWYSCFAKPDQIRIYKVTDKGSTIGFLPLIIRHQYGIRILSSLTNKHCFLSDPLVRAGYEEIFPEIVLKELLQDGGQWDVFQYSFTYSFSQFPGLFHDELLANSGYAWRRTVQQNYQVMCNKSFEDYFRHDLSRKNRQNLMRFKNRLKKTGSALFRHYRNDEALQFWPEFVRLENSGWKGAADSSIARLNTNYSQYYEGLVKLLATNKALHLYFLELEGKNIAGGFGYALDDIFHWAKSSYDEQYQHLSPSNLLHLYIVEDLMTDTPSINLLNNFPWDYGYKHKFNNDDSQCFDTIIFNNTPRGQLLRLYSLVKTGINHVFSKTEFSKT